MLPVFVTGRRVVFAQRQAAIDVRSFIFTQQPNSIHSTLFKTLQASTPRATSSVAVSDSTQLTASFCYLVFWSSHELAISCTRRQDGVCLVSESLTLFVGQRPWGN